MIKLPEFKEKKAKKGNKLTLPVKNQILYGIQIVSTNIKPYKKKISGNKSKRYPIPIVLISKDIISQERIDDIIEKNKKEMLNYDKINKFGVDKPCMMELSESQYKVLKAWLINNKITLGSLMYFHRIGFSYDTIYRFLTEKEGKDFLDKLAKEKEAKKKMNEKNGKESKTK